MTSLIGTRAWPGHGEEREPIVVVENIYDAIAINITANETTGNGFGNIDIDQTRSGIAKKMLMEVITTAAVGAMAPSPPPRPGAPPPPPPPDLEAFYEVLKSETRGDVGYRVVLVSHTQGFYFGDAVDKLLATNAAEAAKAGLRASATQRSQAQAAELKASLRNRGEGMSRVMSDKNNFYMLLSKATGAPRTVTASRAAGLLPLRLDSNPANPSIALGLSRAIEAEDWALGRQRPCEKQRTVAQYISAGGAPAGGGGALAAAVAASAIPQILLPHPAPQQGIDGVVLPALRGPMADLMAATDGRRPAPAQQQQLDAAPGGPPQPCRTLRFPDPSCVWWIPRSLLGNLWEYTRPDKCAPDPDDVAAAAHLAGSCDSEYMVSDEMRSMAELDLVLAMRLKNEIELAALKSQPMSPEEYKAALITWKRGKFEEFMTFFRTADPSRITQTMLNLRRLYEKLTTTGKKTLVRKFGNADPSLDTWGNLVVYLRTLTDHELRSYATHAQLELIYWSCFNAYRMSFHELQMNILIPGDAGTSKTFTMKVDRLLFAEGTTSWVSDTTAKARRTKQNFNDDIRLIDEGSSEATSQGKSGERVEDDPTMKSAMTSGIIRREENVQLADGTRVTRTVAIPAVAVTVTATNSAIHHISEPLLQRNLMLPFPSLARAGAFDEERDEFILGYHRRDPELDAVALERFHILQLLYYIVENLIKVRVFDEVNTELCKRINMEFFYELAQANVPVNRRDIDRLNMNCRVSAIADAVNRMFLSEVSDLPADAEWNPYWIMSIEPLLVVTESPAAYMLGLHCMALIPQDGQALLRHAMIVSNNTVPEDIAASNDATTYMPESFADQMANNGGRAPDPIGPPQPAPVQPPQQQADGQVIDDMHQLRGLPGCDEAVAAATAAVRRLCRVNRYDWFKVIGPLTQLAERTHKHMPDPRPPLSVVSAYLRKLATTYIKVRNRDSTGAVIRGVSRDAARGTLDSTVLASMKEGEHEIPALICDANNSRAAPIYIAQDLLASRATTPEDTVIRTLAALCHRYTRRRRVVVGLPLVIDGFDTAELRRNAEHYVGTLDFSALRTGTVNAPSRAAGAAAAAAVAQRPGGNKPRRFPHISRVVLLEPNADRTAERNLINPLTPEIRAILYAFPGAPTEVERAWDSGQISHTTSYDFEIETALFAARALGAAMDSRDVERALRLIPVVVDQVIPELHRRSGHPTVDYPASYARRALLVERDRWDPRHRTTPAPDVTSGLAGLKIDTIIDDIFTAQSRIADLRAEQYRAQQLPSGPSLVVTAAAAPPLVVADPHPLRTALRHVQPAPAQAGAGGGPKRTTSTGSSDGSNSGDGQAPAKVRRVESSDLDGSMYDETSLWGPNQ